MSEPGDRIGERYRELAREAPPPALDAAILAASRRAVGARPGGAQRWFVPVSVAAVLVLGIGVALRMQVEQPGVETAPPASEYQMPPAAPAEAERAKADPPAAAGAQEAPATAAAPAPPPARRAAKERAATPAPSSSPPAPAMDTASSPAAPPASPPAPPTAAAERPSPPAALERSFTPDPAPTVAPQRAPPPAPAMRSAPPPAPGMSIQSAPREKREAAAGAVAATPEAELERIARLRESGRQDEADRALAEFQRRFPDHQIPAATWERVKPR